MHYLWSRSILISDHVLLIPTKSTSFMLLPFNFSLNNNINVFMSSRPILILLDKSWFSAFWICRSTFVCGIDRYFWNLFHSKTFFKASLVNPHCAKCLKIKKLRRTNLFMLDNSFSRQCLFTSGFYYLVLSVGQVLRITTEIFSAFRLWVNNWESSIKPTWITVLE